MKLERRVRENFSRPTRESCNTRSSHGKRKVWRADVNLARTRSVREGGYRFSSQPVMEIMRQSSRSKSFHDTLQSSISSPQHAPDAPGIVVDRAEDKKKLENLPDLFRKKRRAEPRAPRSPKGLCMSWQSAYSSIYCVNYGKIQCLHNTIQGFRRIRMKRNLFFTFVSKHQNIHHVSIAKQQLSHQSIFVCQT